jgi:hypothetical protein
MSGAGGPISRTMPPAVGLPLDRSKESSVAPPQPCALRNSVMARPSRLMAVLSTAGHWTGQVLSNAEFHFPPVAQTVGFGSGMSKMLYLSMGID